ncbi:MAG: hypothetical protein KatS3mg058_1346 [Roseiflexus sp.]|nr:MAG: hypothetical protein KatS3mg058_1346 [Roseiflexus sp.]
MASSRLAPQWVAAFPFCNYGAQMIRRLHPDKAAPAPIFQFRVRHRGTEGTTRFSVVLSWQCVRECHNRQRRLQDIEARRRFPCPRSLRSECAQTGAEIIPPARFDRTGSGAVPLPPFHFPTGAAQPVTRRQRPDLWVNVARDSSCATNGHTVRHTTQRATTTCPRSAPGNAPPPLPGRTGRVAADAYPGTPLLLTFLRATHPLQLTT